MQQLLVEQTADSVGANAVKPLRSGQITESNSKQRYEFWGSMGLISGIAVWLALALLRSRPGSRRRLPRRNRAA